MKKAVFTFVLVTITSLLYCQNTITEVNSDVLKSEEPAVKKMDFSLQTGTSFSTGAYSGNMYYIAPEITYRFSPKFRVHTSIAFINSNMSVPSNSYLNLGENRPRLFDQKTNETVIYATGDYQVNTRLMITGTVIKNFNSPINSNSQDNGWRNSYQMMSMGLFYKLTPNMSIGADFKMIQGDNLYSNPLYYNNMSSYSSPFSFYR